MKVHNFIVLILIALLYNPYSAYSKVLIQDSSNQTINNESFAGAIKDSKSLKATIIIFEKTPVEDLITVPVNITVNIKAGGCFSGKGGIIFKGPVIIDNQDKHYIFTNSGQVTGLPYSIPEFFGAKPDNQTNCTIPIQKAMKASSHVRFSDGTYLVASSINILSNTTIEGSGNEKTIVKLMSSSNMSSLSGIFQAMNMTNIKISNLTINGNRSGQAAIYRAHNIYIANSNYVMIEKCSSISSNHEGFCFDGSPYCSVINCYTTDSVNSGIALRLSPAYPKQLDPAVDFQSNDFTCTGNTSYRDGNVSGIGATGISINALRCVVSGNTVIEAGLAGIAIGHVGVAASGNKSVIPAQDASYSVFSNNTIKNCGYKNRLNSEAKRGAGIIITYAPNGVFIEDNIITDTYGDAISAVNESKLANNAVIRGNKIDKSDKAAIAIGNHDNVLIENNTISNSGLAFNYCAAIRQEGKYSSDYSGVGNRYINNKIYDTHGKGSAGIRITAGINTKISNNFISDVDSRASGIGVLILHDALNTELNNNHFEGNFLTTINNSSQSTIFNTSSGAYH